MIFIPHSVVLLKKTYRRSNSHVTVYRSNIQRFYVAHVKPSRCEIRRLIIKIKPLQLAQQRTINSTTRIKHKTHGLRLVQKLQLKVPIMMQF
jgi:hypothetical protein